MTSPAHDHEAVRLALGGGDEGGGEKASFLGLSYGTPFFAQCAGLFPDGVCAYGPRRIYLGSVLL